MWNDYWLGLMRFLNWRRLNNGIVRKFDNK
jgi:hypothetical protein